MCLRIRDGLGALNARALRVWEQMGRWIIRILRVGDGLDPLGAVNNTYGTCLGRPGQFKNSYIT